MSDIDLKCSSVQAKLPVSPPYAGLISPVQVIVLTENSAVNHGARATPSIMK